VWFGFCTAPGIFSLLEMLDFGLLRTMDDPAVLRLNVINSGMKPIHIVVSFLSVYFHGFFVKFNTVLCIPNLECQNLMTVTILTVLVVCSIVAIFCLFINDIVLIICYCIKLLIFALYHVQQI